MMSKWKKGFRFICGRAEALLRLCLLAVPVLLMLLPVFILLTGSITSRQELAVCLGPVMGKNAAFFEEELQAEGRTEGEREREGGKKPERERERITWKPLPDYPTLEHYRKTLLLTPQFYTVFWNSVKITAAILAGQLLVGAPAAWAFGVYRFRGFRLLFTGYIVLMLMPFQVTMLSQYLSLDRLGVMDTHAAVILPAVFSTFPVFLMYRSFCDIPPGLLEAGRIDGAGEWYLFIHVGLPLASGGILSAMVLGFLECWNLIEQPLAFLKDKTLWPLSLYLPEIGIEQAGFAFAASVITLIPAVFVFLLGQDWLEQGIVSSGLKE